MWNYPETYDVIVVGGGHAGCEAALASARMGASTLLLTMNLDTIAKMSCNPAIGGVAKGHMVREIDALGGEMGKVIDATGIQFRMLNATKGPAVWAPRAQADKVAYQFEMKHRPEKAKNLEIKQGTTEDLIVEQGTIKGVITKEGISYFGKTVILSAGTFMRGLLHIGQTHYSGGRAGDAPAAGLSASLQKLGFQLERLKTGTPPRIHRRSIDFSLTDEQKGDENIKFSFDSETPPRLKQISCYITYTTEKTKKIILDNLHRSPIYRGKIQAVGPRYCPSIEDKVVRFAEKERHQVFLEPEGLQTEEVYVNGVSSSLPFDTQLQFIQSIIGLEKAEITRPAYAIEYDYVVSGQIGASLETHTVKGLFFAGQINGTSGYEEAAGQGLLAGINAARKVLNFPPIVLGREDAYLGVMIDDLVTKTLDEPYRMFTSRAEHRLLLRQDNADLRLSYMGYNLGLLSKKRFDQVERKRDGIEKETTRLAKIFKQINGKATSLSQILCRPEMSYQSLIKNYPEDCVDYGSEINTQIELAIKYAGYISRQKGEINRLAHVEKITIPAQFNFEKISGLRNEAKQKLTHFKPHSLGQASRIMGVSPADVSVLMVALTKESRS